MRYNLGTKLVFDVYVIFGRNEMANTYRRIGGNIFALIQKVGLTPEQFAERLSYTIKDTWNVIEGKVMIPPMELNRIAELLGVTGNDLVTIEPEQLVPNLEFMKEFSNPNNLDKVLDLMDEYVEVIESI